MGFMSWDPIQKLAILKRTSLCQAATNDTVTIRQYMSSLDANDDKTQACR